MKSILILLVSTALVLSFGIWELKYLEETSDYMLGSANQVQNVFENTKKGYKERTLAIDDLKQTWLLVKKPWSVYINHAEIDNINQRVISYSAYVINGNKEEATNEYENLVDNINQILDSQKVLPENIF